MPDDNDALLAHLTPRFTNRTEDLAVEALGYILSRSGATMRALGELLRYGSSDTVAIRRVQTQVSDDAGTRPDLVGFDERDAECVLIEAKFWAGLTDNQPGGYLKRARAVDGPAVVLFVAPDARVEMLWVELCRRASSVGTFTPSGETSGGALRSAVDGEGTSLMLVSWSVLLEGMSSRASAEGDVRIESDIRQLASLCERMDTDAFLPLRSEEFSPAVPRRMLNLRQLVDEATVRAREGGFVDTHRLTVTPRFDGYGRYLRIGIGRRAGVWLGISFTFWANHRETPLWLDFTDWRSREEVRSEEVRQRTGMMLDDVPAIPIHLPQGVEHDAVLEAVVEQLREIALLVG